MLLLIEVICCKACQQSYHQTYSIFWVFIWVAFFNVFINIMHIVWVFNKIFRIITQCFNPTLLGLLTENWYFESNGFLVYKFLV